MVKSSPLFIPEKKSLTFIIVLSERLIQVDVKIQIVGM